MFRIPLDFTQPFVEKSGVPTPYFQRWMEQFLTGIASNDDAEAAALVGAQPVHATDHDEIGGEALRLETPSVAMISTAEYDALRMRMPLSTYPPLDLRLMASPVVPVQFTRWVIPDTIANQGNYPPAVFRDSVFFATDTNLFYYSDGAAWTQFGIFDDAYGGGWNGSTKAPTQNAVYDKIAALFPTDPPSGVYTPTLTNVANLSASTAYECQYMRIGTTTALVSGRVDIDPILPATQTQLGISLPIASNIGATEDCAGTAFAPNIAGQGAAIIGDAANDRAEMDWVSGDTTNQAMFFVFAYQVI